MGVRGPVPKHSSDRIRRNIEGRPDRVTSGPGAAPIPPASRDWHPQARRWYRSLRRSGQAVFYEASDWASAHLLADLLTRELTAVRVVELPQGGEVVVPRPPGALMMKTILGAMNDLGTTESARRRMRIEIERTAVDPAPDVGLAVLDAYRAARGE